MADETERTVCSAPGARRSPMRNIGCILIAFLVVFGGCTGYQIYQIASRCEREPLVAEWATTDAARASLEEKLKAIPERRGRLELTQDELNAYARREIGDDKDERLRITLEPDGTVLIEATRTIDKPIIGRYYANASVRGLLRIEDGSLHVDRVDALRDLKQTFEPPPQKMVDELKEQASRMVLRGIRTLRNEGGKAIVELDPAVGAPKEEEEEEAKKPEAPAEKPEPTATKPEAAATTEPEAGAKPEVAPGPRAVPDDGSASPGG